jgi:hypothetical protein
MTGFAEIDDLVEAYYQGMHAGDAYLLRRAFDPDARILGFFAGRFLDSPLEGFIGAMTSGTPPAAQGEARHLEILQVRVDGDIATAVVLDTVRGATFTDHLALVRGDGGWRIVGKTYTTPTALPGR